MEFLRYSNIGKNMYKGYDRMEKKYYLILGGSSGIGYAIAKKLKSLGCGVIIVAKNEKKLKVALENLAYNESYGYVYDLENTREVYRIFDFCKEKSILLDGMIYAAGISPLCLVKDNTQELMEKVFSINFFSFIECVKYFQKQEFSRENSRILGISSITAKGAGFRQTLYGSSKAAMIASVKLMARELLNRGIHINVISPGVTDTELFRDLEKKSKNLRERVEQTQLLGIIGAEQISEYAVFLLSSAGDYMTGEEVVVDGGAMLK